MTTPTPDLAVLRGIAEAATPGPWEMEISLDPHIDRVNPPASSLVHGSIADIRSPAQNARHIAAFDPNTALALLDRIEALATERDKWEDMAGEAAGKLIDANARAERAEAVFERMEQQALGAEANLEAALEVSRAREARATAAEATIQRVTTALSNHPRTCDKHTEESPVTCGWKLAVIDVQDAMDGE